MVEGHTDNVPIYTDCMEDNWDLSVKRATSVIRILQKEYKMNPSRMTASGHSEYVPVDTNETADGRALNRRTRIIILPQLDQFFKLLIITKKIKFRIEFSNNSYQLNISERILLRPLQGYKKILSIRLISIYAF